MTDCPTARPRARSASKVLIPLAALLATTSLAGAASAWNGDPNYLVYDGGAALVGPSDESPTPFGGGGGGGSGPLAGPTGGALIHNVGSVVGIGFQGLSQYDTRALNGGFSSIPPDTMGAVGTTQFMETTNGGYAVYSKTGQAQLLISDGAFWNAAGITQPVNPATGLPAANGDSRVLFDKTAQKWVVESFAPSLSSIQIAVSNDANALDGFKSTQFVGYNPPGGGIADYPTLAIDSKAIYIGTNDFNATSGAFQGTTLNVISRNDIFAAGGPQVTSLKQFVHDLSSYTTVDHGFAIQGVNQVNGTDTGKIAAIGAENYGTVRYNISNPGTAGASESAVTYLAPNAAYDPNNPARQPSLINPRVVDTLDDRLSSAVYEYNGMIFTTHTITPLGTDHTIIQYQVSNASTDAVLFTGTIGANDLNHDYWQSSIAVSANGEVVIGYNQSGYDENISVLAQAFGVNSHGDLYALGGAKLLVTSPTNDYHNGSLDGQPATGRQRWGDYSQVTVDPNDPSTFWVIGEFGREPNDAANGHPGGTGGTRWGTWVSSLTVSVPEPSTWAMMLVGFGVIGAASRRRKALLAA